MMKNANQKWLSKYDWQWSKKLLNNILRKNKEVYLFGASDNMYDFLDLFDKKYYLKADKKLLAKRLRNRKNPYDFAKTEEQKQIVFSWIEYAQNKAKENRLEFIDASLTPKQIFDIIVNAN
jgi:pantothenate kinase